MFDYKRVYTNTDSDTIEILTSTSNDYDDIVDTNNNVTDDDDDDHDNGNNSNINNDHNSVIMVKMITMTEIVRCIVILMISKIMGHRSRTSDLIGIFKNGNHNPNICSW